MHSRARIYPISCENTVIHMISIASGTSLNDYIFHSRGNMGGQPSLGQDDLLYRLGGVVAFRR
jgi:hypothetical protein